MAMEFSYGDYSDRAKQVKEFDDAKIGVKGLADSGITTIPKFFIHPPEKLRGLVSHHHPHHHHHHEIPIIDLSDLTNSRSQIVEQVRKASTHLGFFQILNHGIPVHALDTTLSAIKAFHELPTEEKKPHYDRSLKGGVAYSTCFDLFRSKAATWRDTLSVRIAAPDSPDWERVPAICRRELTEWDGHVQKLSLPLAELFCEGLGLRSERLYSIYIRSNFYFGMILYVFANLTLVFRDPNNINRLKEEECLESRQIVGQCYPYCPQPELTLGLGSHTDPFLFTILLQSQREGLQVKIDEEEEEEEEEYWIDVRPIHGALVVNVGDLLQMISNGVYRSAKHRVVASSDEEPRVSVATFIGPASTKGNSRSYGPLPEILSGEEKKVPALYRNFTMEELMIAFVSKETSTLVDAFKAL